MRRLWSVSLPFLALAGACLADEATDDLGDLDADDLATEISELGSQPDPWASSQVASANGIGCLDLPLGPPLPPAAVLWLQHSLCNGGANQLWAFEPVAVGVFRIRSVSHPTLCLDVPGYAVSAGTDIQLWPCKPPEPGPEWNQTWTVQSVTATTAMIRPSADASLCLEIIGGGAGVAKIQLASCGAAPAVHQQWRFRTSLGARTGFACPGTITIGGDAIIPGATIGFPALPAELASCATTNPVPWWTNCPFGTNYIVASRYLGTGNFPYRCFKQ